jgi:hypothetical protein
MVDHGEPDGDLPLGAAVPVPVQRRQNGPAAQAFFERAMVETAVTPVRVTTDKAKCYLPARLMTGKTSSEPVLGQTERYVPGRSHPERSVLTRGPYQPPTTSRIPGRD